MNRPIDNRPIDNRPGQPGEVSAMLGCVALAVVFLCLAVFGRLKRVFADLFKPVPLDPPNL